MGKPIRDWLFVQSSKPRKDFLLVLKAVQEVTGISQNEINGRFRQRKISHARYIVCKLATEELGISGVAIARRINKDPTSVSAAVSRASEMIEYSADFETQYNRCLTRLNASY